MNTSRPPVSLLRAFCAITLLAAPSVWGQSELDTAYAPAIGTAGKAIGIQSDGKVVAGEFYVQFSAQSKMFRFAEDGTNDSTFSYIGNGLPTTNHGIVTDVKSVSCFLDGTVAISGAFDAANYIGVPKVLRLDEAGKFVSYSAPFASSINWVVWPAIVPLPDNGAFLFGDFSILGGYDRQGIGRVKPDGSMVTTFVPVPGTTSTASTAEVDHEVTCVLLQPDGKTLIAGEFGKFAGTTTRQYLVRVDAAGAVDPTFNPNPNDRCYSLALQPDGKILVSGYFTNIGGAPKHYFARLNSDGSIDPSFNCTLGGTGYVWSSVVRADGKILIGGGFSSVNGQTRGNYALLNSDGTPASAYANAGANSTLLGTAIYNDGRAVLAGYFTTVGGVARSNLARVAADSPAVNTLTIDPEGSTIDWTRGGSAPEVDNAEFKLSLDGLKFATLLGAGTRTATGWRLTGQKLLGNKTIYIQAKGLSRGGFRNSSCSVMKTVQTFFRPLPVITMPPANQTVIVGNTGVNFSVAVTSAAALTYQWKRSGTVISGATSATYTIPTAITTAHAGTYTCVVTSSAGSVTSTGAVLTVITPITITKQPVFQAVLPGKPATFSVTATGTSPVYKWFKGTSTTPIPGATTSTYKISAIGPTDPEDYHVEVSNFAGSVPSNNAHLYLVGAAATVLTPPDSTVFALGQSPSTLSVTVNSESPPVQQWLKNGASVAGATSTTLTIPTVKLTDSGKYSFKISNPAGGMTSAVAEVAVIDQLSTKTFIIAQTKSVTMTAIATGNGLTYKWKKGASYLTEAAPNVTGTLTKTLSLKNLTTGDAAFYSCEVTGLGGGHLDSALQQVIVTTGVPAILNTLDLPKGMVGADYNGSPVGYKVPVDSTAELTPNSFSATGLPNGLKIDPVTGYITGKPTAAKSSYTVTIKIANGSGTGLSMTDTLEVLPVTPGLVGDFIGIAPADSTKPTFKQGARVNINATTADTFSGKVRLGETETSFTGGRLNAGVGVGNVVYNNTNTIVIPRKGLPSLSLTFDLDPDTFLISGTLANGAESVSFNGWKNVWSSSNKAALYKGYYTMALTSPTSDADFTSPNGDGFGTFTVADAGTLTIGGKLADGTAFTTSNGFVGPTGQILIYNGLYGTTGGAVWGTSVIVPGGTAPEYKESTITGGTGFTWLKYPQTSGHTYLAGFGPLALGTVGSKYFTSIPAPLGSPGTNVLGSNVLTNDVSVAFTGARVEVDNANPNIAVQLTSANAFKVPALASANNLDSTTISLVVGTGLLTGGFTISEDVDPSPMVTKIVKFPAAKAYGVVVRNIATASGVGYGFFTLLQPPGNVTTSDTLGGKLRVTAIH